MCELGRGKFYRNEDFLKNRCGEDEQNRHDRLSVWKGFKFSLVNIAKTLALQIDVCSRVLRTENFLETLNGSSKDYVRDEFTGATIVTRYGNYRTYKIDEVDFAQSPVSKFNNERKGQMMTYEEYFKEAYNIKVTNHKQPLLKVTAKVEKQIQKGKLVEIPHVVYLIPEFVSLTGMSDDQRANRNLMKEIAEFTKMTPDNRVR